MRKVSIASFLDDVILLGLYTVYWLIVALGLTRVAFQSLQSVEKVSFSCLHWSCDVTQPDNLCVNVRK